MRGETRLECPNQSRSNPLAKLSLTSLPLTNWSLANLPVANWSLIKLSLANLSLAKLLKNVGQVTNPVTNLPHKAASNKAASSKAASNKALAQEQPAARATSSQRQWSLQVNAG
jgi:hypothetical protein